MLVETIYEKLLYSTLKIEILNENNEILRMGTSFVFLKKIDNENFKLLLISNRHIFHCGQNARIYFVKKVKGSLKPNLGKKFIFTIKNYFNVYKEHPDANIDVACLNITEIISRNDKKIFCNCLNTDMLVDFKEEKVSIAEGIKYIGFPHNGYDQLNNLPIVRKGLIASHPKVDFNGEKKFIIDAKVCPGSSGSPVLIDLYDYQSKTSKTRVLGVLSASMVVNKKRKAIKKEVDLGIEKYELNLGVVYKSTAM